MKIKMKFADQIVGLFILISILGLSIVLILLGANQRWFAKNYHFYTILKSTYGISEGAEIKLRGFVVGKVDRLEPDFEVGNVRMDFHIFDNYYEDIVLENSVIEVVSNPLGLGTDIVFHPGFVESGAPKLPIIEGEIIYSEDSEEGLRLIKKGKVDYTGESDSILTLLSKAEPLIENLNNISYLIDEGIAGEDIQHNRIAQILESTKELEQTINNILKGRDSGPVGDIINSASLTMQNVTEATDNLNEELEIILKQVEGFTANLEQTDGLLTRLIDPEGSLDTLLDDDNQLYDQITTVVDDIHLILRDVNDIVSGLESYVDFVNTTKPQVTGILEEGMRTLDSVQDVLEAVKNNPLLRGGVPEEKEQQSTFGGFRDENF
jgi:phospholipid/cholesterol/gamma-HCH transport system substrate-binding protein